MAALKVIPGLRTVSEFAKQFKVHPNQVIRLMSQFTSDVLVFSANSPSVKLRR